MKGVHTNTQAVGSILRTGGGFYADHFPYQEVDDHNYREGNFPKGKARKKDNRHSCKVTVVFVALPQIKLRS